MDGIMKQLFRSEGFKLILFILGLMAAVKVVWFAVAMIFLPSSSIELESKGDIKPLYYRTYLAKKDGQSIKPKPVDKPKITKPSSRISALKLLGVYNASDRIVVTVQKGSKTKVLTKGEAIAGFILTGASRDEAYFEKNGKNYTLEFSKQKRTSSTKAVVTKATTPNKEESKSDVVDSGGVKVVKRGMLEGYMKKPKDIWKDIGISEIKKGKEIRGFRVRFVRKESGFDKLGIKRGDIILAINGERLDSYQDAFKAYKNIQNIENLTLTIKRKNQEMELDYEIK
jgi:general secretion pathway protein C